MKRKFFVTAVGLMMASGGFAAVIDFSEEETRAYAENCQVLALRCKVAGEDAFTELRQKYYVPQKHSRYLLALLTERETRKALYDYICNVSWQRVENKKRIDSLYQDSIDVRLLPDNKNIAGENVSLALRFSDKMGVDSAGYGKIMRLGLNVARHLRNNPRYDYDTEVMDSLRNFLTKEQLLRILRSKNMVKAVCQGIAVWNRVKAAGLIEDEDSASCCDSAIEYYLQEYVINDMFVGHDEVLRKNLSGLWKRQPLIVRMNESVKKKNELIRKKEEENGNIELAW